MFRIITVLVSEENRRGKPVQEAILQTNTQSSERGYIILEMGKGPLSNLYLNLYKQKRHGYSFRYEEGHYPCTPITFYLSML